MRRFSLTLAVATALTSGILSAGIASAGELNPRTKQNLETAMHGEAYANLKYLKFPKQAREDGDLAVANLFEHIAADEGDHYSAYTAMKGIIAPVKPRLE
jgi:hypothetical protein